MAYTTPINPAYVLRGPCAVIYTSGISGSSVATTFYTQGDVTVEEDITWQELSTAVMQKFDKRMIDGRVKIKFKPAGEWEAAAAALWPYATTNNSNITVAGQSIYSLLGGATQSTANSSTAGVTAGPGLLAIQSEAGELYQFLNVVITQQPDITVTPKETMIGEVEFTAIVVPAVLRSTTNAIFTAVSGNAWPGTLGVFTPANIFTEAWTAAWGSTSTIWPSFETGNGFTLKSSVELTPVVTSVAGTIDYTFKSLTVELTALKPLGTGTTSITGAAALAGLLIQGAGSNPGRSLATSGSELTSGYAAPVVLTGLTSTKTITLNTANITKVGMVFGSDMERFQQVTWSSVRRPVGTATTFTPTSTSGDGSTATLVFS